MTVYYFIILIAAVFVTQFIRFKLTRWENIVDLFQSEYRSDPNRIYGFWSEFRQSPKSYPLSNNFLKLIPSSFGLYLQYDLRFEIIRYYKPVMIPWNNIQITNSFHSRNKGGDEYKIILDEEHLGSIFLQKPISDQIKQFISDHNVEKNYV